MVASPFAVMPSRKATLRIVSRIILRSNIKLRLSMYQTSIKNFSSQFMVFRPFICAHPVSPGRTSCLRACSDEYSGRYCIRSGRGPTILISPRRTLMSSGSSSRLVDRNRRPKGVNRLLSGSGFPSQSTASSMVRNFIISNGWPFRPGRCWRNNTGRPNFVRISNATIAKTGTSTASAVAATNISKIRFTSAYTRHRGRILRLLHSARHVYNPVFRRWYRDDHAPELTRWIPPPSGIV